MIPTPFRSRRALRALNVTAVGVALAAITSALLCFGLPIARAQRLAGKGLAGEERGEWIVGLACMGMSLVALALAGGGHAPPDVDAGKLITQWFAAAGLLTGGAAAALAGARARRRRQFVADAAAGKITGYRV